MAKFKVVYADDMKNGKVSVVSKGDIHKIMHELIDNDKDITQICVEIPATVILFALLAQKIEDKIFGEENAHE